MTSAMLDGRRRLIARRGRSAVLRRQGAVTPPTYTSVTVMAVLTAWRPGATDSGAAPDDRRVEILADEITAAGWPAPPRDGDSLVTAEGEHAVTGAAPVYDGGTLIGYSLTVRSA